jgi:CubicO group peptidase (beta-lactamase class C family)
MLKLNVPGMAIGLLHNGKENYIGFGVTNIDNPVAVTPDTMFQAGSITKTVLASTVMRMVDEKKLDLDAPIRAYIPGFELSTPGLAERVTLRHLLTHTGGWLGDYFNDFGYGDDALPMLVAEMRSLPQHTPLGQYWSYNNIGFAAAGLAIERASGQSFEEAVAARVLKPLNMTQSAFFPTEVMTRRFAVGHNSKGGAPNVATPWEIGRASHPAGGLVTTVIDLLSYAQCHINDGAGVMSKASARAMRAKHITATGRYDMGLTWWLGKLGPKKLQFIQHVGATNGFTAHLRIVPAAGFAIALLTNSDLGSQVNEAISALALKDFLGLPLDKARAYSLNRTQLKPYAGRYVGYLAEHTVGVKGGGLHIDSQGMGRFPTPASPVHGDPTWETDVAFSATDRIASRGDPLTGPRGEFVRDADGRIAWMRWGGRLHRKVR